MLEIEPVQKGDAEKEKGEVETTANVKEDKLEGKEGGSSSSGSEGSDQDESDWEPYEENSLEEYIEEERILLSDNGFSEKEIDEKIAEIKKCSFFDHNYRHDGTMDGGEAGLPICDAELGETFWTCAACSANFCPGCWAYNEKHGGHPLEERPFKSAESLQATLKRARDTTIQALMAPSWKYDRLLELSTADWEARKRIDKQREEEKQMEERFEKERAAKKRGRGSLSPPGSAATSSTTSTGPVKKKKRVVPADDAGKT